METYYTLVTYDTTGYIQTTETTTTKSNLREPVGIPFLWLEIPEGKELVSIDVTVTPNEAIYKDLPKSDIQKLQEGLLTNKQDNTDVSEIMLDLGIRVQMLEGGM